MNNFFNRKDEPQFDWSHFRGYVCRDRGKIFWEEPDKPRIYIGNVFDYASWDKKELKKFDEEGYIKLYGGEIK